eukprot:scaffold24240_cov129-Isochrysis_galbana.AAC.1
MGEKREVARPSSESSSTSLARFRDCTFSAAGATLAIWSNSGSSCNGISVTRHSRRADDSN